MCNICETAAERVGAEVNMAPEEVRRVVRLFREESEKIDSVPDSPEIENDPDAPGMEEFVQALGMEVARVELVALGTRPYILIEAEQVTDSSVMVWATCGGGISDKGALEIMEKATEQVRSQAE